MRRCVLRTALCALVVATAVSGCSFHGINSYPLPGTSGTGEGSYRIDVLLPNATTLEPNTNVQVGDVVVGTIRDIRVEDWHARVTVRLDGAVRLPENTTATLGQTSLLGSKHLELAAQEGEVPRGRLSDGDVIPLNRSGRFPETEEVLASLSLVLNGGGLNQLRTITAELSRAIGGREESIRSVLGELEAFVGALEEQKADIVRAIDGLDRLAGTLATQRETIGDALEGIAPAVQVLDSERPDLVQLLEAVDELGVVANRALNASREDLVGSLRDLEPLLAGLADAGDGLVDALFFGLTLPFPLRFVHSAVQGDYFNLFITFDLTASTLERNFLSGTPLEEAATTLRPAREAADPLRAPLGALPIPAAPGLAGSPSPEAPPSSATRPPEPGGLLDGLLGGG